MTDFTFETTPRIVSQIGGAARLGEFAHALGASRLLIVTDAGLVKAGLLQPVLAAMAGNGVAATLFSDVLADPPEQSVLAAVAAAKAIGANGIVGFGGGSSMDTAKLVALLAGTEQALPDIYGIGLAKGPRLPLIQVPTTAGTGSEVTPIAIVTTPTHEKKGVVSTLLYPDLALLDATLTLGLPPKVTAMTGIDAMVHAIESFTSRHKKNPLSDSLAVKALELLFGNIRRVLADGADLAARDAMLQGSMLAGMAFANAPVAAVHALAYPIGGHFHAPHGLSNALVLLPVLRFNAEIAAPLYARLGRVILSERKFGSDREAALAFVAAMSELVAEMPFEQTLREVGIAESDLDMMTSDVMNIQRLLVNNPREVTRDDALAMYREAL